ncbi:MAB_1171c family putative transporter [Streptomyces canus]|uniref:MAB_1171c family putative transporter n=1 Tax=Streptomyces canus TaxID=58343 RepID=UPI0037F43490
MFQVPLITLLSIGVLWKGIDLTRAPHDRVLRFLVAALVMLLGGEVLSLPKVNGAIDAAATVGVGKVAFNGIYAAGLFALTLFFASSVRKTDAAHRRQIRINVGLLVGILIALTASMIATPAALRGHSLGTPHMAEPPIASFYIIGNAYFIYAYLTSALWALRYARRASRYLGPGLWTMASGLLGLAITSVNRTILVALRIDEPQSHEAFNTVNWSMSNWAMGIVLTGICYSACVQLTTRLWSAIHHRRMHQELAPLWTVLTNAYPELVLNQTPAGSKWRRLRRRGSDEQRFYRRLIECRDGLVRLSPYLARVAPDADLVSGPADRLAQHITEALALKPLTESPHTELSATRVASPAGSDLGADARELISISRALRERKS